MAATQGTDKALERYSRQMRFAGIGADGQERLRTARVLLCGCGALGTVLSDTLVRAGVGFLRIVDRDFVDLSNLQRQVLFDEDDVAGPARRDVAQQLTDNALRKTIRFDLVLDRQPADLRDQPPVTADHSPQQAVVA